MGHSDQPGEGIDEVTNGSVVLVPHCSANQPFHEVRPAAFPCSTLAPSPPLTARQCRCGRPLDACGHHRSACAVAGVLGRATRWKLLQPRSVEKQVLVCDSTPWSETWIFCLGHSLTTGGWRSSQTVRPCSTGHNWPSTQQ